MKVKTNLTQAELELVGTGLIALSKSQKAPELENEAEKRVIEDVLSSFDLALDSLKDSIVDILSGD